MNTVPIITLFGGLLLLFRPARGRRAERRLYWTGTAVATASAFFVMYPPDAQGGLWLAGGVAFVMVVRAYATTPYIKIGGKIYAFGLRDSRPDPDPDPVIRSVDPAPDSYSGIATARKTWWLLVGVMPVCFFMVVMTLTGDESLWYPIGGAAVLALGAVSFGHGDASWGFPVARGQLIQFVIVGVLTLGSFTALYVAAYATGKRWPLRSKRSLEYQAHPHLRKKFSRTTSAEDGPPENRHIPCVEADDQGE